MMETSKLFDYLKWEDKITDVEGQNYIIHSAVRTKRNCYEKKIERMEWKTLMARSLVKYGRLVIEDLVKFWLWIRGQENG